MMFNVRTEPVKEGTAPYNWNAKYIYECTWYSYYRALECGFSAPVYWDRATKTGSYTHAKEWIKEFREPWIPIADPSYKPVAGDILVYDYAELGHVIFCETDVMTSEYRSGRKDSFRNAKIGDFNGVLLGVLHYPYSPVNQVERNKDVDQIETTDEALRIRLIPSLDGEIIGHVQLGFYNVLDKKEADGYTWYEIEKDRWCANITTVYHEADQDDFVKQLERFLNNTKARISALEEENREVREDMKKISNITERWL